MPTTCSAPRCTNSNKDGYCCTMFAQDPKLKQKWIDAAGIPDWKLSKLVLLYKIGIEVCIQMFYNLIPINNQEKHIIFRLISIY